MNNITQWSYSRHETWELCPKKAYFQYVAKYPTGPKSPVLVRGIDAHEVCAEIYRGNWPPIVSGAAMVPSLSWRHVLAKQKSFYGVDLEAEVQLAYDKDWIPTAWYDKQTVYRAALDGIAYTPVQDKRLQIYEHKTGRKRESHMAQADWYAGVSTLTVPDAEQVAVDIHYLDLPANSPASVTRATYTQAEARHQLIVWKSKAAEMMADEEFPTRAGPHCRWCPFAHSVGGPCALG